MRLGKKFRKFFGFLNNTTRSGPPKRPALPYSHLDWLVLVRMISISIYQYERESECFAFGFTSGMGQVGECWYEC